jgi:hypothetical protein
MKYLISIFSFALLGIILSGCGGGGGSNNDSTNTDTDVVVTEPEQSSNSLVDIANQSANSATTEPDNESQLSADINALFGNANAEPIDIADDENLGAVINRVQNR